MRDINSVIGKKYDFEKWNCYSLVQWFYPDKAPTVEDVHENILKDAKRFKRHLENFKSLYDKVDTPDDGNVIMMGRSHIGVICVVDGVPHVLHTSENTDTILTDLDTIRMQFPSIEYLRPKQ